MSKSILKFSLFFLFLGVFQLTLLSFGYVEYGSIIFLNILYILLTIYCLSSTKRIDWTIPIIVTFSVVLAQWYHGQVYKPLYDDDFLYISQGSILANKTYKSLWLLLVEENTIRADTYKYLVAILMKLSSTNYISILFVNYMCCGAVLRLLSQSTKGTSLTLLIWLSVFEFFLWSAFAFKDTLIGLLLLSQLNILLQYKVSFGRILLFMLVAFVIDEFKMGLGWSTILLAIVVLVLRKGFFTKVITRIGIMSILITVLSFTPTIISSWGFDLVHIDKINAYNEFALNKNLGQGFLSLIRDLPIVLSPIKVTLLPVPLFLNFDFFSVAFVLARILTFCSLIYWMYLSKPYHSSGVYVNYMLIFWLSWIVVFMPGVVRHVVPFIPLISHQFLHGKSYLFRRRVAFLS